MQSGFFKLEHLNVINGMTTDEARQFCNKQIDDFVAAHPGTKMTNIDKARRMVAVAKSKIQLMNGVKDFAFAHPSENLKVK